MSRGALFIAACLLGLLVLAVTLAILVWNAMDAPVNISAHGFVALALGAVGSLAVGGGLMALVFFSNRSGHDQAVHEENSRTFGEPPEDT